MPENFLPSSLLALETSCPRASLCLRVGGEDVFSSAWTSERSHNSRIFDALREAKPFLEKYPPALVLVGAGPGSYSGIRVALAVADGLSLAYEGAVVAVPSWEALPHEGEDALVLSDARRGGWAIARLKKGKMSGGIRVLTHEEAVFVVREAGEEGIKLLSCEDAEKLAEKGWSGFQTGLFPQAQGLLDTWDAKTTEERDAAMAAPAVPFYVREPHITQAKRAAWQKGSNVLKCQRSENSK